MWFKYGLKAQKLLAQGIALGIMAISKAPCKGKSFVYCQVFESFCPLPLLYPSASDFQFRYAPVTVGSGRVGKNLRNFNYEPTLKSSFWFFSLQNAI